MADLISRKTGKQLSVADVFNCENLAGLAAHIQGESFSHDNEYQQILQDSQLALEGFISTPDIRLNSLLLTGATGFLGIYLLATLQQQLPDATVYCLGRGKKGWRVCAAPQKPIRSRSTNAE